MIKHIFLDMDGTLLDSNGKISQENIETIQNCPVPITLVSARSPHEMHFALAKLHLSNKQVAFNGGLIFEQKSKHIEKFFCQYIATNTVMAIFNLINYKFPKIAINWYSSAQWFVTNTNMYSDFQKKITHIEPVEDKNFETIHSKEFQIYKIMLISFDLSQLRAVKKMLQTIHFEDISVQLSDNNHLEITSLNATKNNGIAFIQSEENLQKKELAAFGDGENDLKMFECVETSIAMGNASFNVKNKATFITKTNDNNGVAFGIHNLLSGY
ncbi:Cof-type HAD-IIB family hydrolase [Ligilactobacillus sp. WILCCON 0076]|uniref:Cof-type HAD-IIB family hydrolase n=1 Tax=Ligilactobacillus ubinensis TaxID=2876789 RepID=A0A9X2JL30_9LACO|nr:HAD family hydrolase [Ligilactobacillus ubinensis]MCP0886647.1 Cof-type HAD-IIB family hydrolase [Ligilactobacillus ubinensis]